MLHDVDFVNAIIPNFPNLPTGSIIFGLPYSKSMSEVDKKIQGIDLSGHYSVYKSFETKKFIVNISYPINNKYSIYFVTKDNLLYGRTKYINKFYDLITAEPILIIAGGYVFDGEKWTLEKIFVDIENACLVNVKNEKFKCSNCYVAYYESINNKQNYNLKLVSLLELPHFVKKSKQEIVSEIDKILVEIDLRLPILEYCFREFLKDPTASSSIKCLGDHTIYIPNYLSALFEHTNIFNGKHELLFGVYEINYHPMKVIIQILLNVVTRYSWPNAKSFIDEKEITREMHRTAIYLNIPILIDLFNKIIPLLE